MAQIVATVIEEVVLPIFKGSIGLAGPPLDQVVAFNDATTTSMTTAPPVDQVASTYANNTIEAIGTVTWEAAQLGFQGTSTANAPNIITTGANSQISNSPTFIAFTGDGPNIGSSAREVTVVSS